MTNPVTPPPELVQQWIEQGVSRPPGTDYMTCFATQAAQYGADQELEACCELLVQQGLDFVDDLRAARRPKPPSLKKEALAQLDHLHERAFKRNFAGFQTEAIRRALEQLND